MPSLRFTSDNTFMVGLHGDTALSSHAGRPINDRECTINDRCNDLVIPLLDEKADLPLVHLWYVDRANAQFIPDEVAMKKTLKDRDLLIHGYERRQVCGSVALLAKLANSPTGPRQGE